MNALAGTPGPADVGGFDAQLAAAKNETTYFKADSALLRELGERLVGKP